MSSGFSERDSPFSAGEELNKYSQFERNVVANRSPFPHDFPLIVLAEKVSMDKVIYSRDFMDAKKGDASSAARIAKNYVTDSVINIISSTVRVEESTLLTVSSGENRIPFALADRISCELNLEIDDNIYQISGRRRKNASTFRRLWSRKKYDGLIIAGRSYIIVDDVLTQGGTLADLRGYVESGGGNVVGAVVLTAAKGSHLLRISDATLRRLRERANLIEDIWKENFGFGFEALTNSEGRALLYFVFAVAKSYGGKPRKARKY